MIYETIKKDIITAMKAKNAPLLQTLRSLDSEIQKKAIDLSLSTKLINTTEIKIESKQGFTDDIVTAVLQKGIKQRKDSIEAFEKGNRPDLVADETAQLNIYKQYLPTQLSEDEIRSVVLKAIADSQITINIGNIMKVVVPLTKGKADGKLVNKIVQEEIAIQVKG